jgi:hypothetical protein
MIWSSWLSSMCPPPPTRCSRAAGHAAANTRACATGTLRSSVPCHIWTGTAISAMSTSTAGRTARSPLPWPAPPSQTGAGGRRGTRPASRRSHAAGGRRARRAGRRTGAAPAPGGPGRRAAPPRTTAGPRPGAPGRLDHETVGRQQRASRHQRCHTPDRRHGGDLARQQHAAGERRRSAAGKANHGAAVQAQVPDQLTQVACTGGDRSRWVKARPAASGPVRNNQS